MDFAGIGVVFFAHGSFSRDNRAWERPPARLFHGLGDGLACDAPSFPGRLRPGCAIRLHPSCPVVVAMRLFGVSPGGLVPGRLGGCRVVHGLRAAGLHVCDCNQRDALTNRPGARHFPRGLRRHHRQLGGRQRAAPLHDASCGRPAVGGVVSAGRSFP